MTATRPSMGLGADSAGGSGWAIWRNAKSCGFRSVALAEGQVGELDVGHLLVRARDGLPAQVADERGDVCVAVGEKRQRALFFSHGTRPS
jgi:hypothetical protein